MKVGDLVRMKKATTVVPRTTLGLIARVNGFNVEVIWPRCRPFWTQKYRLEVINESR